MNIDFQRAWMLLDLIIKASEVGMNEVSHIVAAAREELKAVHNAIGEAKAAAKAEADAAAPPPVPATPTPPIESIPRDAAGNIESSSTLRRS